MAQDWLLLRLYGAPGTPPVLPAVMPRLAQRLRSADPDAFFFFVRAGGPGGPSIELWLDTEPEVYREVTERLHAELSGGWRLSAERDITRPVRHPHESERDVQDELAAVSSEFALTQLMHGEPEPDEAFRLGVAHLRGVTTLLPESDRRDFLFLCWQHWSAGLTPSSRVELSAAAGLRAATVPQEQSVAQQLYLYGTRQAIDRQRPGTVLPERYLIFSQAGATHDRLGIPPTWSAAAALTVRNELAGRSQQQAPAETAMSGRRT